MTAGPAGIALLLQCVEDRTVQLLQTQISPGGYLRTFMFICIFELFISVS